MNSAKKGVSIAGGLRVRGGAKSAGTGGPMVSVVTPVYNGVTTMEQAINSVITQTYDNLEHIVVDGGSQDGTVDLLKEYDNSIDYWVSEPDGGISSAFNKGLGLARGDIIGIINADDFYEPHAVARAVEALSGGASFVFGGCTYIDDEGRQEYIRPAEDYIKHIDKFMPHIHHPTVFVRREVYERFGGFDESLKYAMDYDFFLRLFRGGCVGEAIEENLAYMRIGGVSTENYFAVRREVRDISVRHGQSRVVAGAVWMSLVGKHVLRGLLGSRR